MNGRPERFESIIDEQIRLAQERGDFDNLPGKGKPLPGLHGPDDELWWVRGYIEREGLPGEALLPPGLALRKEIEMLPATVAGMATEEAVRELVSDLNRRIVSWIRNPTGPAVRVGPVKADEVVEGWRAGRATARATPVRQPDSPANQSRPEASTREPRPGRRRWWRRRHDHV